MIINVLLKCPIVLTNLVTIEEISFKSILMSHTLMPYSRKHNLI
ncbi:hypothetical protein [Pseudolactococcus carnosus]|nr:hypothetical protein [Lactococcus carnosus]